MPDAEPPSGPPPPVATAEPVPRSRLILAALSAAASRKWRRSWVQDSLVAVLGLSVLGMSLLRIVRDKAPLSEAFSDWAQSALLLSVYVVVRSFDILLSEWALDRAEDRGQASPGSDGHGKDPGQLARETVLASEIVEAKRSATWAGAAGGVAGMIAGEALAKLASTMDTQPARWALTILGILVAHLLWGWRYRIERELRGEAARARRDALTAQIWEVRKLLAGERKCSPASRPVIEELERQHLDLIHELGETPLPTAEPGVR